MALPVVAGATILCSNGMAPGQLLAVSAITIGGAPALTIQDVTPISNICPCGLCNSLANPTVASATAAALGVLTPMPCIPAPVGSWVCAGTPLLGGTPGLSTDGTLLCAYGGSIKILDSGQKKVVY
ncbi:MAG: DUF4280 domain-containing protein [Oscillospiraceae bacterium]